MKKHSRKALYFEIKHCAAKGYLDAAETKPLLKEISVSSNFQAEVASFKPRLRCLKDGMPCWTVGLGKATCPTCPGSMRLR